MPRDRVSSGVHGLDEVLGGGYLPGRAHLVRGGPGCGKTTLGLHFLAAGGARGEAGLFVSLGEAEHQIRGDAERASLDVSGVRFLDLSPTSSFFAEAESYDIFSASEVESGPTTRLIASEVEAHKPQRVFVDSMTQFRYLAPDPYQYRRQVLSFLRFLAERGATVLFASEASPEAPDADLQFLADAVIELVFDGEQRGVHVRKLRGSGFRSGRHTFTLGDAGMRVYPALVPEEHQRDSLPEKLASGVSSLDALLHGGIERGTSNVISGPSGTGKSTVGLLFAVASAARGERSVVYTFDETPEMVLARSDALRIPARAMVEAGALSLLAIEPLRCGPDEFSNRLREEVEERGARMVMLDSAAGFRQAVRGGDEGRHLHALARYLGNMGVTTLIVDEVEGMIGDPRITSVGISYLADNILFLRYIEVDGALRRLIGVLKKRTSSFDAGLRELRFGREGVELSPPLRSLRRLLAGVPEGSGWDRPASST